VTSQDIGEIVAILGEAIGIAAREFDLPVNG
jgi:hypothetical protein